MSRTLPRRIAIDWYSFSVMTEHPDQTERMPETAHRVNHATRLLRTRFPELLADPATATRGRKPYKFANGKPHTRLLWSPGIEHVTVELTGQGCELSRQAERMDFALRFGQSRATRIDFAIDIETDTLPVDFVAAGYCKSFKSTQEINSETGQTCVIGSPKSDRFCRVYRYYPPHDRARFLRIETVQRGESARQFALMALRDGVEFAAMTATAAYQFIHPDYNPEGVEKVKIWRPETHQGGRVRWFRRAVVPATRDMLESGSLTATEVFSAIFDGIELPEEEGETEGDQKPNQFRKLLRPAKSVIKRNSTGGYE